MTRIVLRIYLAYHMYKPIPIRRQVSENLRTQFFSGLKVLLLWLKSIPWAGNELRGDDEEIKTVKTLS